MIRGPRVSSMSTIVSVLALGLACSLGAGCGSPDQSKVERCADIYATEQNADDSGIIDEDDCYPPDHRKDGQLKDTRDHCSSIDPSLRSKDERCRKYRIMPGKKTCAEMKELLGKHPKEVVIAMRGGTKPKTTKNLARELEDVVGVIGVTTSAGAPKGAKNWVGGHMITVMLSRYGDVEDFEEFEANWSEVSSITVNERDWIMKDKHGGCQMSAQLLQPSAIKGTDERERHDG